MKFDLFITVGECKCGVQLIRRPVCVLQEVFGPMHHTIDRNSSPTPLYCFQEVPERIRTEDTH